jgi:hypothetical protein
VGNIKIGQLQTVNVAAQIARKQTLGDAFELWPAIIRVAGTSVSDTCKRGPTLA